VKIEDQFGNVTASVATVTANAVAGSTTWTIGGTTSKNGVAGVATFTNLTASATGAVTGASISFTSPGLTSATSNTFNIPLLSPPALTAAAGATLDNSFNITFPDNAGWRGAITLVQWGATTLVLNTDYTITAGVLKIIPGNAIKTPGTLNITVTATNYSNDVVSQTISAGAATTLNMTAISSPQSTGVNFSVTVTGTDQFGNNAAGNLTMTTTAGTITTTPVTITLVNGTVTFTANVSAAGTAQTITATAINATFVTSNPFNVFTTTATDFFRSQASGNWSTAGTWQSSHDSITWFTATSVPTATAKRVLILGSNNVTISGSLAATNIVITSSATLTVNATRTLTLNTSTDTALYVFGTLANSGVVSLNSGAFMAVENAASINNLGTITPNAGSTVKVNSGGTYFHNQNGGTIVTAQWDVNSTCTVNGVTNTVPSGLGQSFGNFTWSSTLAAALSLTGNLKTINGNFSFLSTGGSSLRLTSTQALTLNVGGNFIVNGNGGTIRFTDNSANPIINVTGSLLMEAGTLTFDQGAGQGLATLNVTGNVTISGGTVTPNSAGTTAHVINVAGNWTLNTAGTFTNGSSIVVFNGASAQLIEGTKSTTFTNLTMSGAGGVTLSKSAVVTTLLTFTNGIISTTATNLLTINNGGTVTGASNNSFVNGPITKIGNAAFTFPVGATGTGYIPIAISAPATVTSAFLAQYNRASAAALGTVTAVGLNHVSVCEYWTLNQTSGASTINVTGFWNTNNPCNGESLDYYITDVNSIVLAHFNGTNWNSFGNTTITGDNVTGGSVTWNGVNTFSPFTLGSTSSGNPLPVVLVNFRAVLNNSAVDLSWTTEQETNSNYFDIQRSADGSSWSAIGSVTAQGNSATATNYSFIDNSPLSGVDYYRLKMVDKDGSFSYSSIKVVSMNSVAAFKVFPNPAKDFVNVTLGHISDNGMVRLINLNGQSVFTQTLNNASGSTITIPVHNLAEGTYMLQILGSDGSQQTGKIVIIH
jgi:hypothetical protein